MRQSEDKPLRAVIRDNVISNVNTSTNVSTYGIAVTHNATGVLQVVVSGNQVLNNRQFGLLVQGADATPTGDERLGLGRQRRLDQLLLHQYRQLRERGLRRPSGHDGDHRPDLRRSIRIDPARIYRARSGAG